MSSLASLSFPVLAAVTDLIAQAPIVTGPPSATGTFYDSMNPNTLGAIAGSSIGIMGALLGTVAGTCAPRGKAKGFVIALFAIMITGGFVFAGLGIGAFMVGAPWRMGYSLLLPGGLAVILGSSLFPVILVRYRQAEMRRIEAAAFRAT